MRFTAVVPVKSLDRCKSRLAPGLSPKDRADLQFAMLKGVVRALAAADRVAGFAVVTADARVARLAREYGGNVLAEPQVGGLNAAVTVGCRNLAASGADGLLVVPADLPLIDAEICDEFLAAAEAAGGHAIAPDLHGCGTNAIAFPAVAIPRFSYGLGSYGRHLSQLAPACARFDRIELALDIDTLDDLARLAEPGWLPATKTVTL